LTSLDKSFLSQYSAQFSYATFAKSFSDKQKIVFSSEDCLRARYDKWDRIVEAIEFVKNFVTYIKQIKQLL